MQKYFGSSLIRAGVIGVVLAILVIAIGLQPERLVQWATALRYQALFSEAGGLIPGNDVTVSGIKVGYGGQICQLDNGDALVGFTIAGKYALGSDTTAHIRTGTLLGERVLALESAGSGTLSPNTVIPISRTSSPYSLTDAVSELTANTAGTNTESLNQSLDTLSATLDQIAPQLGPTFDGVSRLSRSLNNRNESLAELLKTAGDVTGILLRAQPAGQHADPQRQRPGWGAQRAQAGDRQPALGHVGGVAGTHRRGRRQREGAWRRRWSG